MIAQLVGKLTVKELDHVEILTAAGVGYELAIPLGVYEQLPAVGEQASLHTHLVVRDDAWLLFGFTTPFERSVFRRLLGASGVGPALALGMLSALSADRVVRAIIERDIHTLQGIPRVGRKKAERVILDLADKMADVRSEGGDGGVRPEGTAAEDAIRALISLGYNPADAEKGVRKALDAGGRGVTAPELIRLALSKVAQR